MCRTANSRAHGHGDLVLDLEPKVAEGLVKAPHRLPDALGPWRVVRVRWLVVDEVRVDQLVSRVQIAAARVDLLERPAHQFLGVHGQPRQRRNAMARM
jgi:hypothetical protein